MVTIGEVDHVTLSSRENAVISKKIDFSLVNDEFQPSTFPIGISDMLDNRSIEKFIQIKNYQISADLHI